MIGIISLDNICSVGHSLFNNFRLALKNYLQQPLVEVSSIMDLININTLIIVDEHYIPHKQIWQNKSFINAVNEKNIKVIIFNFEKIYNSQFSWNIEIQNFVERIKNRVQYVSDIKDAEILRIPFINKQFLSKSTHLADVIENKSDDIIFIGQINEYYPTRAALLHELQAVNSKIKIIKTDRKYSYEEFINILNKAKYILNPLGTGEFINLRFYEALNLGCIVIQQYTDEMEKWYPELNQSNVLKFKTVDDFKTLDFNKPTPHKELFLEDYFEEINFINIIDHI
jgi:hypothetical protein